MGLLSSLFEKRLNEYDMRDPVLVEALGGRPTAAGVRVNEETALRLSAVYACVRCISEDVAKLPLILYRRRGDGDKERARGHPLYRLLRLQPNPLQTAFTFVQTMQAAVLLYGNAYAWIDLDRGGRVIGVWYLHPEAVEPVLDKGQTGRPTLIYRVTLPEGGVVVWGADRIIHVPALGFDGVKGKSVIRYCREQLGTYMAASEYAARFFGNDTTPGLVLTSPRKLSEQERQTIKSDFASKYGGVSKKFRMAVLESGWDIKPLSMPLEDAQFIELSKFGVEDVARIFRVPPHKIGHLERATFSNIEHQSIEYQGDTIEPWVVRWEQELMRKLLLPEEQEEYYVEFLMDALLRSDTESRYRAYGVGIQWGFMSPNEVRAKENLPPRGGNADSTWMPLNMVPVEAAGGGEAGAAGGHRLLPAPVEQRGRGDAGPIFRRRLALSYKRIFADVGGRVVRREVQDIKKALNKHDVRNIQTFNSWLNEYYADFNQVIERYAAPAYYSYGGAVVSAAAAEVGVEDADLPEEIEVMLNDMVAMMASNHAARHRKLLQKYIREGASRGEIEALLEELENTYPEKYASREVIRVGGAVARTFFSLVGVAALRWVACGKEPCPLCKKLNGTVVSSSGGNFLRQGDTLEVEGANPLKIDSHIGHPPLHDGCECQIAPA